MPVIQTDSQLGTRDHLQPPVMKSMRMNNTLMPVIQTERQLGTKQYFQPSVMMFCA